MVFYAKQNIYLFPIKTIFIFTNIKFVVNQRFRYFVNIYPLFFRKKMNFLYLKNLLML